LNFKLNQLTVWLYQVNWSPACSLGMNNWESVGTGQPIVMINLNRSIVLAVSETLTAIKQLVFALHTHTHTHTHRGYLKSKNNFKSSILNHTRICALKPSYSCIIV
jgi:hypothetical protein